MALMLARFMATMSARACSSSKTRPRMGCVSWRVAPPDGDGGRLVPVAPPEGDRRAVHGEPVTLDPDPTEAEPHGDRLAGAVHLRGIEPRPISTPRLHGTALDDGQLLRAGEGLADAQLRDPHRDGVRGRLGAEQ